MATGSSVTLTAYAKLAHNSMSESLNIARLSTQDPNANKEAYRRHTRTFSGHRKLSELMELKT